MKKFFLIILLALFVSIGVSAQSVKGLSHGGATGLITIPTAKIGWDDSVDIGVDVGYHLIFSDDPDMTHIPKVSVSLFNLAELAFAYDSQGGADYADFIFSGKFNLPLRGTTHLALGGNVQILNDSRWESRETAMQIYVAATYPGTFFGMPAETTVVVGKTLGSSAGAPEDAIDFGMGFSLIFLPDMFRNYIHWITDFANFSYSLHSRGTNPTHRGAFNTGLRFDLSEVPALSRFKLVVDAQLTDLLDRERTFVLGATFGMGIR